MTEDDALSRWTAADVAAAIRMRRVSAREILDISLSRIGRSNRVLNSFGLINESLARRDADAVDACLAHGGDPGPLCGVPIGIKDFEEQVSGMRTTAGSLLHAAAAVATADSVHVARLRKAGAVIVGRTTCAEFAMASDTNTAAHGATRNPWSPQHTPGGSSGGSAAAVASGQVPMATGSDSGGSIRSPASHCNLVGLKPSFGRIPLPVAGSVLNCLGVLVKTVADAALHLDVACGPHPSDRFSLPAPSASYLAGLSAMRARGLRAVYSADLGYNPVDPEIAQLVAHAADRLIAASGMQRSSAQVRLSNVYPGYVLSVLHDLRCMLDADHPGMGARLSPGLAEALARTADISAAAVHAARQTALKVEREAAQLFEEVDIVLSPVTTALPHLADGPAPDNIAGESLEMVGVENFPMWANYAGCPSIAVPAGFTGAGLPVGLLITSRRLADAQVLDVAAAWETIAPWPLQASLAAA